MILYHVVTKMALFMGVHCGGMWKVKNHLCRLTKMSVGEKTLGGAELKAGLRI